MNDLKKVLAIVGPTAVGKTSLTIEIARQLEGEIIGLDSRQIYAGMAIGTAQPTVEEQALVPHHLVAFRSPDQRITAGEYAELAMAVIDDLISLGRKAILCGGAGLYYRALSQGIFAASGSDLDIRSRLEYEYNTLGPEKSMERIAGIDPDYTRKIHPNNRKRLIRALEIFEITGLTPSEHFSQQPERKYPLNLFTVLLTRPMAELEQRISTRTDSMLHNGWLEETKRLLNNRGVHSFHAMDSIGYRQVVDHLEGRISYQEMVELINLKTRQYAKRQLTWFKKEPVDLTIDLSSEYDIDEIIAGFLNHDQ